MLYINVCLFYVTSVFEMQTLFSYRQGKAEWIGRLGSVRLTSTAPWQQERLVVGMTKSPVEGSTVVLVKLDSPLQVSDFVRPICLPRHSTQPVYTHCHALGWTRNRESLYCNLCSAT